MSDIWSNAVHAHQEGNFRLAKQLYDQVIEDAKQAQDTEAFVIVLYHLARLALDDPREGADVALHRFKKLLKSQEKLGDNQGMSKTFREIAIIYEQQDQLVDAIRYGERALASAKEVFDQQQMGASYHLLGLLYQYADLQPQAVTAMKEAQNQWEQIGNVIAWQNTTAEFAEILEKQGNLPLCIRELRRLVKTLDDDEDMEDIAAMHFQLAMLFARQKEFANALIHMLACLFRHQELESESVQRDAMVLLDLRDKLGHPEFEVLLEKKIGLEGKDHLMAWLEELFPPENSDPALQNIPEPQSLQRSSAAVPEAVPPVRHSTHSVSANVFELPPPAKQGKESTASPSTQRSLRQSPKQSPKPNKQARTQAQKKSQNNPSASSSSGQSTQRKAQQSAVQRTAAPKPTPKPKSSNPSPSIPQPVAAVKPANPSESDFVGAFFDDDEKTEAREKTPLHHVNASVNVLGKDPVQSTANPKRPSSQSSPQSISQPTSETKSSEAVVDWDDMSDGLDGSREPSQTGFTDTSLPNEWTQYTDSVDGIDSIESMRQVSLQMLAQHFFAALLGIMSVLAMLKWLL